MAWGKYCPGYQDVVYGGNKGSGGCSNSRVGISAFMWVNASLFQMFQLFLIDKMSVWELMQAFFIVWVCL